MIKPNLVTTVGSRGILEMLKKSLKLEVLKVNKFRAIDRRTTHLSSI